MMRRRAHGLSMVEVVVGMLIVSVALVSSLTLAPALVSGDAELRDRARARWLAEELLSESMGVSFDEPTPAVNGSVVSVTEMLGQLGVDLPDEADDALGGATPTSPLDLGGASLESPKAELDSGRRAFDEIADYDGWEATPPQTRDGHDLPDFAGWSRAAHVTWADPATLANVGDDTGLRRVEVVVSRQGVELARLVRFRSRAGWEAR